MGLTRDQALQKKKKKVHRFDDIAMENSQNKQEEKAKQNEWGLSTYETLLSSVTYMQLDFQT